MLRNYIMAALRDLLGNRTYAAVNVLGMALGFAAALVIALYVRDEYSYDRFWPDHSRIFRVVETLSLPGRPPISGSQTFSDVAQSLKMDFPAVDMTARLVRDPIVLRVGSVKNSVTNAYWADPDFFHLFPLKAVSGATEGALREPNGIVLTQTIARRFFGSDQAAGKAIELNGAHVMRVTAVVEDLPSNTHLSGEVFLPSIATFSEMNHLDSVTWASGRTKSLVVYTYVRLRPGANVEDINAHMRNFVQRHVPGGFAGIPIARALTMSLSPVTEAHLRQREVDAMKPQGDPATLQALGAIAGLILVISAGNFVGMMTARASRRALEVGVRKTVGAGRWHIVVQFMGEATAYVAFALVLTLAVVQLFLPQLNAFLQRRIEFGLVANPSLAAAVLGLGALVGLAAGSYPALALSSVRPTQVLRGRSLIAGGSDRLRQALVVFQFAALVALLVATITIGRQARYAIEDRLRLPQDQIYMAMVGCPHSFATAAARMPGVESVSCTSSVALAQSHWGAAFAAPLGATKTIEIETAMIDYEYFKLFGIKPIAGRLLSPDHGEDDVLRSGDDVSRNPALILNESAAKVLGFSSARSAVGQYRLWSRPLLVGGAVKMTESMSSQIVGIVPDFSIGSIRDRIEPTAYYVDPPLADFAVLLKLSARNIPETMQSLKGLWARVGSTDAFEGMFLSQYVNDLYADVERQVIIFSAASAVAVVIAVIGILGLTLFTVERRTKEIGVRKAMGASRRDVLCFLLWQFARPLVWAGIIACPCAYFIMRRWLEGFAYHISLGPSTFIFAGALSIFVALAAVIGHALVLASTKPVEALRYE